MSDSTEAIQRLGPLAELPAVLESLGVDVEDVLRPSGLARAEFVADGRTTMRAAGEMLERAAALAGRQDIGLQVGARADHHALGAVGELMACAPTLRSGIEDYIGLQIGYSRAASVSLQRYGSDYAICYGIYNGLGAGVRQVYDLALTMACNALKSLTDGRVRPSRVLLCLRPPADTGPYVRAMGLLPQFDQEQSCVVVPEAAMDTALPGANPERRSQLLAGVSAQLGVTIVDPAARVRHALRSRLLLGGGDLGDVARLVDLHPRTLERALARSGTTFARIRDEVRSAIARELLDQTDLPVGRVSDALSYSTHSAFIHAFHRWTGMSPSRWRESAARPATGAMVLDNLTASVANKGIRRVRARNERAPR